MFASFTRVYTHTRQGVVLSVHNRQARSELAVRLGGLAATSCSHGVPSPPTPLDASRRYCRAPSPVRLLLLGCWGVSVWGRQMQREASGVWQGTEKEKADRRGLSLFMCRTSEDDGSSVGSRSSSDSSHHSEVLPLEAIPSFDKSSTYHAAGWWPPPRTSRGAVVALICALSAAVSLSLCGGYFGGLCWNDGGGNKSGSKVLKMGDGGYEKEDKRRSWRRPIKCIIDKLREGQDGRRKRRDVKLELENSGVPGTSSRDGRKTRKRKTSSSSSSSSSSSGSSSNGGVGVSSTEELNVSRVPAVFTSQIEAARGRVNEEKQEGGREEETANEQSSGGGRKAKKRKRDGSASKTKTGEEGTTTKRKRRALQALWGRVIGKLRGGKGGSSDGKAEVETRRLRMLKELKELVEERHGQELWGRAKAARHELDDGLLLRYLEMAFWTMETMGQPLPDAVASTVRWREEARPHLVTDQQVAEEAMYGKMYVRGYDREGRPIIHYRPGLEKSFDTEKGLNLLFYTLERAKSMLPKGQTQFAVVADCAGFGPSKTPPLPMLKTAFVTMQRHYPMRLGYVVIVNAGGPIVLVWKIISAVLEERTKDKIAFLSKKEAEDRLTGLIDPSVLPVSLPGGLDNYSYTNEDYLSSL